MSTLSSSRPRRVMTPQQAVQIVRTGQVPCGVHERGQTGLALLVLFPPGR
ncbi:hypothetical protein ACWKSP_32420 [Micromonosporaceae bacterium Da 78-11]